MYVTGGKSIRAMSLQRHQASDNIRIIPAKSDQIDGLSAEAAIEMFAICAKYEYLMQIFKYYFLSG